MPRVTLVYSMGGYIFRGYDVPQNIIDQGPQVVEEYVWDSGMDPEFERDNTELQFETAQIDFIYVFNNGVNSR